MDKYYKQATKYLEKKDTEKALTTFIVGVDSGFHKCAYGLVKAVTTIGSFTLTEDEAISIYQKSYPKLKEMALMGDHEAMFMIGYGILQGFVEDDDEPCFYWFEKAFSLGNQDAGQALIDFAETESKFVLYDINDKPYTPEFAYILMHTIDVIRAEVDGTTLDDLGISDLLREEKLRREIHRASEDYDYEE